MPISNYVPRNMRMNVSQFFMYNLGLKNCHINPDKQEIKGISTDSMQCCMNSINKDSSEEKKKFKSEETIEIISTIETAAPKLQHNFIPYPDHNYGQLPPLTPPEEVPKVEELFEPDNEVPVEEQHLTLLDPNSTETEEEQEGVTRCICGFEHDDGYMICCDNCSSWQHIECMGIKSSKVPEKYSCHKCSPRELDIEGARAIQAKKKENMSEDDDDEDEETCSEDETSNKTMYTAISNTPTRITLLSNTSQQSGQATLKNKNRRGNKVTKKKLSDQRNTRRKTKKKEKSENLDNDVNCENLVPDSNALNDYISAHKLYEEIEENKYDDEFKNMHFKLPEVCPSIDFKSIVKCHQVLDVSRNRKGLVASFDIPCGNFILEYKGTLMSRKKFEDSCRPIFKDLCPYVMNYTKIDHMLLVIDARDYGNDARFVRRSCLPNAELQHITSNGSLHIMIISKVNILQDKEITVPFDFTLDYYKGHLECACNLEGCMIKKQNEELKNKVLNNTDLKSNVMPPLPLPNECNVIEEGESENDTGGEESKHEKLSREDRKLQAYMKQFEKLEKKQDTGNKKGKEAKTPVLKVAQDENTIVPPQNVKPTPPKKIIGGKRKINFTGKRRTRQSSCSSEPVSPTELQDAMCCVSTPTTPVVCVGTAAVTTQVVETTPHVHVLRRQTSRKEKEPLTLTLPIQRKAKADQPADDLTILPPPVSIPSSPAISPAKPVEQQIPLSLSVETELESTPLKTTSNLNGLLQIAQAPNIPVSTSLPTSLGVSTCEEKIGDVTSRIGESYPSPVSRPVPCAPREEILQRRYYGSIKKHWLRQYSRSNLNSPNVQSGGFKQVSLAALVASLSRQHVPIAVSPHPIARSIPSCLPLKRRHLLRAAKYKDNSVACSANRIPICSIIAGNQNIFERENILTPRPFVTNENILTTRPFETEANTLTTRPFETEANILTTRPFETEANILTTRPFETEANILTTRPFETGASIFNSMISNDERSCGTLTCNNIDYVAPSQAFTSNLAMHDGTSTSLVNKVGHVLAGSNTRLTYSLTPSIDTVIGESNARIINPLHSVISDKTSQLHSVISDKTSPLHSVISDKTSQLDSMVDASMGLQNANLDFSTVQVHSNDVDTNNQLMCVMNTNSQFQSGIEFCRAALNSNVISTDSYPGIQTRLLVNSVQSTLPLNTTNVNTITTSFDVIESTNSQLHCAISTTNMQPHCAISTTNSQLHCALSTTNAQPHTDIETAYQELSTINDPLSAQLYTKTTIIETSVGFVDTHNSLGNTLSNNNNVFLHSSSVNLDQSSISNDEPTCKKQRIDTRGESPSDMGLEIVITTEPNSNSSTSLNTTACKDNLDDTSLLISSQNDYSIQNMRPNSLENVSLSSNPKYIATSPHNSMDNNLDTDLTSSISQGDAGTTGKKKLSFKEYRNRRSQKVPTCNSMTHLSTSEQSAHLPVMPVSPAQKINEAAGLLLTPRTVSLTNFERTPGISTNIEMYMSPSTQSLQQESIVSVTVTNGVSPTIDTCRVSSNETSNLSPEAIQEVDMKVERNDEQVNNNLGESDAKHTTTELVYGNNATFEPVSSENEYDSESPVDDSVSYLNTIHTEITKNPFSIHNDITKHPFGKKQNPGQNRAPEIAEIDDDASSTHSNMSSTSYGSVSEVAHERSYPAHQSYSSREQSSRDYSTHESSRENREYYPSPSHSSFSGTSPYYQSYSPSTQQPTTRSPATPRLAGYPAHHNNYTLSSNQTPRQRQTHRGYIPF